jgi:hypothetical protein
LSSRCRIVILLLSRTFFCQLSKICRRPLLTNHLTLFSPIPIYKKSLIYTQKLQSLTKEKATKAWDSDEPLTTTEPSMKLKGKAELRSLQNSCISESKRSSKDSDKPTDFSIRITQAVSTSKNSSLASKTWASSYLTQTTNSSLTQ